MSKFNVTWLCKTMCAMEIQIALSDVKWPDFYLRIADRFFYHNEIGFGAHSSAAPVYAEPVAYNFFFNWVKFYPVLTSAIAIYPYIFKYNKKRIKINF